MDDQWAAPSSPSSPSSSPPPRPGDTVQNLQQRRVYFEHLSEILLAMGFSGERVGVLVAELDERVALVGGDPVDELGPVGDLANALTSADSSRRRALVLGMTAVGSTGIALAVGLILGLNIGREVGGAVEIPLTVVAQVAATGAGVTLLQLFAWPSRQGRRTFGYPPWRPFLLYLIGVVALVAPAAGRVWATSMVAAVAVAVVAGAVGGLALRWLVRFQRIRVPDTAGHLQQLSRGWLGR